MSSIRFGFLGAGQIAYSSIEAIHSHPQGQVVAVHDVNPVRIEELRKVHAIPKAYETSEALLADPEIDAVYIALPNKFHVPLTIAALEAGKHVVLEKPFAMSYEEAKLAADAACKAGKVLNLGMNLRFARSPQQIKTLVESGALGEIHHAKAFWFRRRGIPKLGTWFNSKELAGGGCLNDIGVHLLDLCLYLLDRFDPVSVTGATYTKFGNRGLGEGGWGKSDRSDIAFDVEDFATGLIRFADGSTVALDVSWAMHIESDRFDVQLHGSEGGALAMAGKHFHTDAQTGEYVIREDLRHPVRYAHGERFHNFINHLLGTEELCVTVDQALKVQRILDALQTSSATGREVIF